MSENSDCGLTVGPIVEGWQVPPWPTDDPMQGQYCRVERLDPDKHAADLFAAKIQNTSSTNWVYLPYGPFESVEDYRAWMEATCLAKDPLFWAIIDLETGKAVGIASYLRIDPSNGSIEVGHIHFSPLLQKQPAATEAMYLMMRHAFELGYRRYEWKCNALNRPSRDAAMRLGLSYEGIFRQQTVSKGRNRDTAWYAAIDKEWPAINQAFQRWLNPMNFDEDGNQRISLSDLTHDTLVNRG